MTTRRLAERIEYSQPVLYGHFPGGKDEIVAGVALEGFAELATTLRAAVDAAGPGGAPGALIAAYLDFAAAHPAVYTAMFESAALPFGRDDTPAPLNEGFAVLRDVLAPATSRRPRPVRRARLGDAARARDARAAPGACPPRARPTGVRSPSTSSRRA